MKRGEWVIWWQSPEGPEARFFDSAREAFGYLSGFCSTGSKVVGQGAYAVQVL